MVNGRIDTSLTVGFLTLLAGACVPQGTNGMLGTGGSGSGGAGTGGATGTPGDAGSDASPVGGRSGAGGGGGGSGAMIGWGACEETPKPLRASGTILELPFDLFLEGQPFIYGEPNPLAAGGALIPLNVRFYVSEVALLRQGADPVPVDIVTATGVPQPYDVHLFNAEDAGSRTIRVLAPTGTYTGISFLFGLNLACNQGIAANRRPPLTDTSELTWPHPGAAGFGYLFLRYEARLDAPAAQDAGQDAGQDGGSGVSDDGSSGATETPYPLMIHMGGDPRVPSAPVIRLDGSLSIPATGSVRKSVRFVMDQVFKGATTDVDLTGFNGLTGAEVIAGERLRRNAPGLQLFVFGP